VLCDLEVEPLERDDAGTGESFGEVPDRDLDGDGSASF
jgi:hypothetical protein